LKFTQEIEPWEALKIMKTLKIAFAVAAAAALSACCYRPCPRPCAPSAPSYNIPACAPAPYAQQAQPVKRMYQAPAQK